MDVSDIVMVADSVHLIFFRNILFKVHIRLKYNFSRFIIALKARYD